MRVRDRERLLERLRDFDKRVLFLFFLVVGRDLDRFFFWVGLTIAGDTEPRFLRARATGDLNLGLDRDRDLEGDHEGDRDRFFF